MRQGFERESRWQFYGMSFAWPVNRQTHSGAGACNRLQASHEACGSAIVPPSLVRFRTGCRSSFLGRVFLIFVAEPITMRL